MNKNVMNPNTAQEIRTAELKLDDAVNPLLQIRFVDKSKTPESPNDYASVTISPNTSSTSKLLITLKIGKANSGNTDLSAAASTTYEFSASGVVVASGATATAVKTLGALIAALNAIEGVEAKRLNAPADYSLDTDDFIALAETRLSSIPLTCLYKDASEVLTAAVRIGVPRVWDHGRIEIVRVVGFADSNSATDCVFKISRDPSETDATQEVELAYTRYVPDGAITELYDFHEAPPSERGPLLVEITSTTSLAEGAYVRVAYRNAEY